MKREHSGQLSCISARLLRHVNAKTEENPRLSCLSSGTDQSSRTLRFWSPDPAWFCLSDVLWQWFTKSCSLSSWPPHPGSFPQLGVVIGIPPRNATSVKEEKKNGASLEWHKLRPARVFFGYAPLASIQKTYGVCPFWPWNSYLAVSGFSLYNKRMKVFLFYPFFSLVKNCPQQTRQVRFFQESWCWRQKVFMFSDVLFIRFGRSIC